MGGEASPSAEAGADPLPPSGSSSEDVTERLCSSRRALSPNSGSTMVDPLSCYDAFGRMLESVKCHLKDMMEKLFLLILALLLGASVLSGKTAIAMAEKQPVTIYFFEANGCPHCADERPFLQDLTRKYSGVTLKELEVTKNKKNAELLKVVGKKMNFQTSGVPVTIIGKYSFVGWLNKETNGKPIEDALNCAINEGCTDVVSTIGQIDNKQQASSVSKDIKLPFFGTINAAQFSLPMLTVIIGLLDGFNPCAMWTLIFLIGLLVNMKDRLRMWILGIAFVVASGALYYTAMSAWLNIIIFLGFVVWLRVGIGGIALVTGFYNIRDYIRGSKGLCKVTRDKKRVLVLEKLRQIAQMPKFWLAFVGIVLLAGAVNLVEMLCSAGLPTIFNQVLALNDLPAWQNHLYVLGYIFFYMLDDLVVLIIAMVTLKTTTFGMRYANWIKIVGGVVMVVIGLLMIIKPEWLFFG